MLPHALPTVRSPILQLIHKMNAAESRVESTKLHVGKQLGGDVPVRFLTGRRLLARADRAQQGGSLQLLLRIPRA